MPLTSIMSLTVIRRPLKGLSSVVAFAAYSRDGTGMPMVESLYVLTGAYLYVPSVPFGRIPAMKAWYSS